jgi:signal transduction histidine kinase
MVSHELRTPLNAVLGWADILQRGFIDKTKRGRALKAIHTNAGRQVQLIDELLDVSRIISGKRRLERAAIDLAEIVRARWSTTMCASAACPGAPARRRSSTRPGASRRH